MIHPTAIIADSAKLEEGVQVGAFSIVGEHVSLGAGTIVGPHVIINGHTTIGKNNHFYQFSSIGEANQDKKYAGEPTLTIIGDNNIFRECCTVHRGTAQDNGVTRIGNNNLFMCYIHIAHDCQLGDEVILANNTTLAGHVHIGDWAILGGATMVHQYAHIGAHAFCSISSIVLKDIPPYVMVAGRPAVPRVINTEGLKRRGFSPEAISNIKRAYKTIYRLQLPLEEAHKIITEMAVKTPELIIMSEFISKSNRGIIR
ncbi:MAG: acyl-[acyl-carrier-protein]--UDP-N-acetylglucosamine O-acyltransferase [Gammaproteobacteria bacterium]|nr:MAG: acyl-[acyl-carrier-protein]--UDP-N-acetylglucosamine O-acyltransferase [Gammaproteobacteria bacterium]